jgi:hypothetical protein
VPSDAARTITALLTLRDKVILFNDLGISLNTTAPTSCRSRFREPLDAGTLGVADVLRECGPRPRD